MHYWPLIYQKIAPKRLWKFNTDVAPNPEMLVHPSVRLPYIHPSFHPYFGLQTIMSTFQWIFTKLCMFIIPPTYEVCGGIFRMSGYIVFAFSFVRSFVRTFVRSFVCMFVCSSFRHRVKVFTLKFIRPPILKTLWWISFIFGMMVDIGLKFLSAPSPPWGWPWGQGHGLRIFIKKSKFFVFKFI